MLKIKNLVQYREMLNDYKESVDELTLFVENTATLLRESDYIKENNLVILVSDLLEIEIYFIEVQEPLLLAVIDFEELSVKGLLLEAKFTNRFKANIANNYDYLDNEKSRLAKKASRFWRKQSTIDEITEEIIQLNQAIYYVKKYLEFMNNRQDFLYELLENVLDIVNNRQDIDVRFSKLFGYLHKR